TLAGDLKISITAGTFNGLVSADDVTGYISGGQFSALADSTAYAKGYVPTAAVNGYYGVAEGSFVEIVAADAEATFTYDGSEKTFELTEADADVYTVTGTASAADTGKYTVTITANDGYVLVMDGEVILGSVALTYTITAATDNEITGTVSLEGWTYGETANTPSGAAGTYGEVVYMYATEVNGEYTTAVPADAGTYYVKAVVEETANYNAAESKAVSFEISKAANSILIVMPGWTYGEAANEPTWIALNGTEDDATITYYSDADLTTKVSADDLAAAGAGTYYVQVAISGLANYEDATATASFTIAKATIPVSVEDVTAVAGQSYSTGVTVDLDDGSYTITYTYDGEDKLPKTFSEAGTYVIHFTVTATSGNYEDYSGSFDVFVTAAEQKLSEVTIPAITTSATYDGTVITFVEEAKDGEYTVTNGSATAAGSYVVIISLAEGYKWSDGSTADIIQLVTIEKADFTVTTSDEAGKTSGTVEVETKADTDKYTVTYFCNGETSDEAPSFTDAGTYVVYFIVSGDNYNDYIGTYVVTVPEPEIELSEVTIPEIKTSATYTGSAITFVEEATAGEYTVTNASATDAGTYLVIVSLSSGYVWADGTSADIIALVTIGKADLTVTVSGYTGEADGEAHSGSVTATTVDETEATVTYSGSETAPEFTEAGTYLVSFTVTAANHNSYTGSYLVVITEAVAEPVEPEKVEAPEVGSTTVEYTGSEITFIDSDSYDASSITITGNSGTNPGTYEVVISLKDSGSTVWTDGTTADIRITFTIIVKVVAPAADDTTFTYTGSAQTYAIADSDLYTVAGNVQTNAGTYTVTVSLIDKEFTCWADNTTAAKTYTFTIAKASNSVTDPTVTDGVPSGSTAKYGEVTYKFYTDEACANEVSALTDSGTYYVKAYVAGTDNYAAAESQAVSFTIQNPLQDELDQTQQDLDDAKKDLEQSQQDLEDAQQDLDQAQTDLSQAQQDNADTQKEAVVSHAVGITSISIILIAAVVVLVLLIMRRKKSK
ncbi:MAG: hypothetical protein LUE27_11245, partial [Clostridia bacterium]|nr:hypothetical protein [Clostridia bacterium]